jgi:hypothetical protein
VYKRQRGLGDVYKRQAWVGSKTSGSAASARSHCH